MIATGPGMYSPVVAAAAVGALACLHMWQSALNHRFGSKALHVESRDPNDVVEINSENNGPTHQVHPLPLSCVLILLLFNTIFLGVLLSTSGLAWVGWTASAINWVALAVSCWWSWNKLCNAARSTSHIRDAPIELTEMLLGPPEQDAESSDANEKM
jgi:hypothetical protein